MAFNLYDGRQTLEETRDTDAFKFTVESSDESKSRARFAHPNPTNRNQSPHKSISFIHTSLVGRNSKPGAMFWVNRDPDRTCAANHQSNIDQA